MSQKAVRKREQADKAYQEAKAAGLLPCGKASSFFQSLRLGEGRPTCFMVSSTTKEKVTTQWWASAELVRVNRIMEQQGISSKIRAKALRNLVEGKELPEKAYDAVAVYTERLIAEQANK